MSVSTKFSAVILLAAAFGALAFGARDGRAAAPLAVEPAQVTMLICTTVDSGTAVVNATSTVPGLDLYKAKACTDALKSILDAKQVIVDVKYHADRVIYTAVNATAAQDFDRSRSNKERG